MSPGDLMADLEYLAKRLDALDRLIGGALFEQDWTEADRLGAEYAQINQRYREVLVDLELCLLPTA